MFVIARALTLPRALLAGLQSRYTFPAIQSDRHPIHSNRMKTIAIKTHTHKAGLPLLQTSSRTDLAPERSDLIILLLHPLVNVYRVYKPLHSHQVHQQSITLEL